jgi:hypothetical protein
MLYHTTGPQSAKACHTINPEKARVEEAFGPGALDCAPRRARRRWHRRRALVSPTGWSRPLPRTPRSA